MVKAGFKQTEVGVIPEDWRDPLLDSVAKRGSGHTPDKSHPEYWGGSIKWVSLQDSDRLDRLYIEQTAATITEAGLANSSAKLHPPGTVVLSRDAGVGRSAILRETMAVSQHFMAWTCGPSLHNHFLYWWLQSAKPEFERIAMGNTIKTIGLPYFQRLHVPLPEPNEQRNIAEALGDADALIESLEQLLIKKRHVKEGAMQELLTGEKRLPGFTGSWKMTTFGEVARLRLERIDPRVAGPHDFCVELEHIRPGEGRLDGHTATTSTSSLKSVFRSGDVLFGKLRAYLRKHWLATRDGVCSTEIWVLTPRISSMISPFLYQLVTQACFIDVASTAYGTHMPRSDWNVVKNFEVPEPHPNEQAAIAEILTDMDADLAAVEAKLTKARQLKQGMMQELLTGSIRLA